MGRRLRPNALAMLADLESPGKRPMEIVVIGTEEERRFWGRAYINHYPPMAHRIVGEAHISTVNSLIRYELVSLHHTDHRGNQHWRINERGKTVLGEQH